MPRPTKSYSSCVSTAATSSLASFGLPDNYLRLTSEDQRRRARLAVLADQSSPEQVIRAWSFFRTYYLEGDEGFRFYKRKIPSPALHYKWVYDAAKYGRNMIAACRSFAKSTVMALEWPLFLALTRPGIDVLICYLNDELARKRGTFVLELLEQNRRLRADFGALRVPTASASRRWSMHYISLANRSKLRFGTIRGSRLGDRPDYIVWDDIDPDPHLVKNWKQIVEDRIDALFNVYVPMLDGGSAMLIIGTLGHRGSFMSWAFHSNDTRLGYWNRTLSAIIDQNGNPEWPEKFDRPTIAHLERELGPTQFAGMCLNRPRAEGDSVLRFHSRRTAYDLEGLDDLYATDPLACQAQLVHYENSNLEDSEWSPAWRPVRRAFGPTVRRMFRLMTMDYGEGMSDRSDYSGAMVLGIDDADVLWVLDLWLGRASTEKLRQVAWNMAYRWKVNMLAIEAVGLYTLLYQKVAADRGRVERLEGWVPRLFRITYPPHYGKASRISSLEWRFDEGRVKVPNRHEGVWRHLHHQIENFVPDDTHNNNLEHDDALDMLAMHSSILRRPGMSHLTKDQQDELRKTFAQRLVKGELEDPQSGIPYLSGMVPSEVPVRALIERQYDDPENPLPHERPLTDFLPGIFDMNDLAQAISTRRMEITTRVR